MPLTSFAFSWLCVSVRLLNTTSLEDGLKLLTKSLSTSRIQTLVDGLEVFFVSINLSKIMNTRNQRREVLYVMRWIFCFLNCKLIYSKNLIYLINVNADMALSHALSMMIPKTQLVFRNKSWKFTLLWLSMCYHWILLPKKFLVNGWRCLELSLNLMCLTTPFRYFLLLLKYLPHLNLQNLFFLVYNRSSNMLKSWKIQFSTLVGF